MTIAAIACELALDRKTVRRLARAERADDLLDAGSSRPSGLDPLADTWHCGSRRAVALLTSCTKKFDGLATEAAFARSLAMLRRGELQSRRAQARSYLVRARWRG
jgi:hypothetical protein